MYECRECQLEMRTEDANEAIVSVDIIESVGQTFTPQYDVLLCAEHIGIVTGVLANNRTLHSITVRARLN